MEEDMETPTNYIFLPVAELPSNIVVGPEPVYQTIIIQQEPSYQLPVLLPSPVSLQPAIPVQQQQPRAPISAPIMIPQRKLILRDRIIKMYSMHNRLRKLLEVANNLQNPIYLPLDGEEMNRRHLLVQNLLAEVHSGAVQINLEGKAITATMMRETQVVKDPGKEQELRRLVEMWEMDSYMLGQGPPQRHVAVTSLPHIVPVPGPPNFHPGMLTYQEHIWLQPMQDQLQNYGDAHDDRKSPRRGRPPSSRIIDKSGRKVVTKKKYKRKKESIMNKFCQARSRRRKDATITSFENRDKILKQFLNKIILEQGGQVENCQQTIVNLLGELVDKIQLENERLEKEMETITIETDEKMREEVKIFNTTYKMEDVNGNFEDIDDDFFYRRISGKSRADYNRRKANIRNKHCQDKKIKKKEALITSGNIKDTIYNEILAKINGEALTPAENLFIQELTAKIRLEKERLEAEEAVITQETEEKMREELDEFKHSYAILGGDGSGEEE